MKIVAALPWLIAAAAIGACGAVGYMLQNEREANAEAATALLFAEQSAQRQSHALVEAQTELSEMRAALETAISERNAAGEALTTARNEAQEWKIAFERLSNERAHRNTGRIWVEGDGSTERLGNAAPDQTLKRLQETNAQLSHRITQLEGELHKASSRPSNTGERVGRAATILDISADKTMIVFDIGASAGIGAGFQFEIVDSGIPLARTIITDVRTDFCVGKILTGFGSPEKLAIGQRYTILSY